MKSSPASSASFASARQSSQLADQRSGTVVAERPDEQLAPNSPILSALSLYIAMRDCMDAAGASTVSSSRKSRYRHYIMFRSPRRLAGRGSQGCAAWGLLLVAAASLCWHQR